VNKNNGCLEVTLMVIISLAFLLSIYLR